LSAESSTTTNTPVLMPKLGQAMTEGTVLQWHRRDGERVEQGQLLLTIETDKATFDIEAPASGVVHILVPEGQEVRIGTVIGEIGDAAPNTRTVPGSLPEAATLVTVKAPARNKKVLASPKAKQLAAERGIDLATVTASSADGVISAADVEKVITANSAALVAPAVDAVSRVVRERRPLTGIRKITARRTQESWQTIPHIVQMVDVDATELLATRTRLKPQIPSLTLNDLILYASAQVMAEYPELNATVEGETLVLYDGVDVGFAVDTPRGLVVPVMRRADKLSVGDFAAESVRLIEAARNGRLGADDIGNASLTVSNLGMFGIRFGTPVINLGEPILVFVGAVEDRPVVDHGQIVIRPLMTLSIAYDHRVTDGVGAAAFTRQLKQRLESGEGFNVQRSTFNVENADSRPAIRDPQPATGAEFGATELSKREIHTISGGSGYTVGVRSSGHSWSLDEPTSDGGTDAGPDPVSAFLGALLSCMTISFKAAARRRKITVERITGRVQANPRGQVKSIMMTLEVWSPDLEENVRAVLDVAKRGCYVSGVLKAEIEFTVGLQVHRAAVE
jgi:pyruvate dehydrogenase E2 component (dihydrolipoamide acetyltransferase)